MCDVLNIHARLNTHFLMPNAFAIKQDVERAVGTTTNSLFQISIETMREVKPQNWKFVSAAMMNRVVLSDKSNIQKIM